MDLASAFNGDFQVIAAFLIFVIGYLALLLAAIACVAAGIGAYRGAGWLFNYARKSGVLETLERLIPCTAETLAQRIAVPRKSSL